MDVLAVLRNCAALNRAIVEIVTETLEIAAVDTSLSQKTLAEALDIPPSALRGLRASTKATS